MSAARAALICAACPGGNTSFEDTKQLNEHYRDFHASLTKFSCGNCSVHFLQKTSLIRHIKSFHQDLIGDSDGATSTSSATPLRNMFPNLSTCVGSASSSLMDDAGGSDLDLHMEVENDFDRGLDLNMVAAKIILELRITSNLTGNAIKRFQAGCLKMLENYRLDLIRQMSSHLRAKGLNDDEIRDLSAQIGDIGNPFKNLKSTEEQLNFFSDHFGLVKPEPKFLDRRLDKRLDPQTNCYVQTEVIETFQYVSITESLTALLSVKKNQKAFFTDYTSKDGVIRSYSDGFNYRNHPFLTKYHNVLQILLFYDELESANALGSKTIIHKLGVFFFQCLNAAAHESSKLSSIHLLALTYADDMKKDGAFEKVLLPFVQEMKRLTSEAGVQIEVDGQPFVLRAALVAVTADTLAAHDLLGFLGPSAKHFCRVCMITREEFREHVNSVGELRHPQSHDFQVQQVKQHHRLSSAFGVKSDCALNKIPFFHCCGGSVFDIFHDILEGIAPLVVKCVVRHFIIKQKYMSVSEFNAKLASFDYGLPDRKNKPSPNFVKEMLTDRYKNLKQTGSQMGCLVRVLPFVFGAFVPLGDEYMNLIFLLQNIMQIVFSFEIRLTDIDRIEGLIHSHNELFKELFIDRIAQENQQNDQEDDGSGEDEDDPEELEASSGEEEEEQQQVQPIIQATCHQKKKKKPFKVHMINKMHHWVHYPEMMRCFGPPVRMWCAKFEATLKVFRQFSFMMNCFKNVPKTMAQVFQLKDCAHINISEDDDDSCSFEFAKGEETFINEEDHPILFRGLDCIQPQCVLKTKRVTINGEEYRPGLFLCMSGTKFSLICSIFIVEEKKVYFYVKPWKVICLSERFNAYQVSPDPQSQYEFLSFTNLAYYHSIAPWTAGVGDVYLSLRTIVI